MAGFENVYQILQETHQGACAFLQGMELQGEKGGTWTVLEKVTRTGNCSGGTFSVGYIVRNDKGVQCFMKASDTSLLAGSINGLQAINRASSEHIFERTLLDFCHGNNMDKIVHAIDYGQFNMVHENVREFVFYIIFELADGDARSIIDKDKGYDFLWVLYALTNLTTAVQQLHKKQIAHNDIKPSNLLLFKKAMQKLGDLGRATHQGIAGPFDSEPHPGDMNYAAPEQLYKVQNAMLMGRGVSVDARRASDLYLLGSMAYFFITGLPLTTAILNIVHNEHMPMNWTGPFDEVLPYWQDAHGKAMVRFEENLPRTPFGRVHPVAEELFVIVNQLCHPNPHKRGHPKNHAMRQGFYSVERYVSAFDRMLKRYQVSAVK